MNSKPPSPHIGLRALLSHVVVDARVAPACVAGVTTETSEGWSTTSAAAGSATGETPFDWASVTKPLFATLVARLVAEGATSWEAPLAALLPELRDTPAGPRSLEELLSHRAGLVPHVPLFEAHWSGASIDRSRLLRAAATATRRDAGPPALYSDLGYLLVGAGIERLLGAPLDRIFERHLTGELGLKAGSARAWSKDSDFLTRVAPTEIRPERGGLLRGVVHDDNAWTLGGTGCCGHAGLFGTLGALLAFGRLLLEGLDSRGPLAGLVERLVRERPGGSLRLGFDGISGPTSLAGSRARPRTFGHLGFTGTSLWCDPERRAATVLLTNRVYPTRDNPRIRGARREVQDALWRLADELSGASFP